MRYRITTQKQLRAEFWQTFPDVPRERIPGAAARIAVRREIRFRLRCNPKGKGNRAWKRWDAMLKDPNYLVWPDYAL